ncbi:hypothetical protein LTR49_028721, partial [Elasticomyces elasticus]
RSPTYPPHPAFERPNSNGMPQFAPASYQSNASPLPSNEASTSRISHQGHHVNRPRGGWIKLMQRQPLTPIE